MTHVVKFVSVRLWLAAVCLMMTTNWVGPACAEDNDASETEKLPRQVRVLYLVSSDRGEQPRYTAAIQHAIEDLQGWYSKQLAGITFQLHQPIVEVVQSKRPAAWFTTNPNGQNQDDWGFNNALQEAKELLGAKQNDPQWVWVLYSDGPGDKGRGGSGVCYLPEDDLLGLVGRHPTQPDPLRWIAGLGHELGHAFGLPHPADTVKDVDAIMWTGIYGKYPDHTYLTGDDKKHLLRSRFFYDGKGNCVGELGQIIYQYTYAGGAFNQHAGQPLIRWTETKANGAEAYEFEELRRDDQFIVLFDASRGFSIRLPVKGGMSSLSIDREQTWRPLYDVLPKSKS